MPREQIGTIEGYAIFRQSHVEEDLIALLEGTIWGADLTHYEHYYVRNNLLSVPHPHIYTVRDETTILGAVVLCRRTLAGNRKAYYLRYYAAHPSVKGTGLISRTSVWVMDFIRRDEPGPVVFYASTVYDNQRMSHLIRKLGFEEIGFTATLGLSRRRPRSKGAVSPLSPEELRVFLPRLEEYYHDYAFWIDDHIGLNGQYYVLREGDEIVAGAQMHQGLWRVKKLPGVLGKIVLPLLPYTPLRRIIDPRAFRFLAFEGIYLQPGKEHRLQDLIETVLYRQGRHAALIWMIDDDPRLPIVRRTNRMGLLQSFLHNARSRFWVSFHHIDPAEQTALRRAPIYISCLDYL